MGKPITSNNRRVLLTIAACITAVTIATALWLDAPSIRRETADPQFRVSGNSMAPTLLGPHRIASCAACEIEFPIDAMVPVGANMVLCGQCGREAATDPATQLPGDVIIVQPLGDSAATLQIGDLVAIRWDTVVRAKRIAALDGDTVSLDSDDRLLINGTRLEDHLRRDGSTCPVATATDESRWSPRDPNNRWRDDTGTWIAAADPPWLVYHHHSAYYAGHRSGVLDDYWYNASLTRRLFTADRLLVRGNIRSKDPIQLQVAFWTPHGNAIAKQTIRGGNRFEVSYYDATSTNEDLPVCETSPLAVRVDASCTLDALEVRRYIHYRLNRTDDRDRYPIAMRENECFVVGDNVPVSIDSRSIGVLPTRDILGTLRLERR